MESLVIQSNRDNMPIVEHFLCNVCEQKHLNNYFATISVAVMQAVDNAIVHGNKCNESKQVQIQCGPCKGGIYFEVQDQGEGFNYDRGVASAVNEESGRGLCLINMLADSVSYNNEGRQLRMEFLISGIESSSAEKRSAVVAHFFQLRTVEV